MEGKVAVTYLTVAYTKSTTNSLYKHGTALLHTFAAIGACTLASPGCKMEEHRAWSRLRTSTRSLSAYLEYCITVHAPEHCFPMHARLYLVCYVEDYKLLLTSKYYFLKQMPPQRLYCTFVTTRFKNRAIFLSISLSSAA